MNKLLLIGPNSIHLWKYLSLIKDFINDVLIITDNTNNSPERGSVETLTVDFSLRRPLAFWKAIQRIRRTVADWQPDLVHVHQANTSALAALVAARPFPLPVVVTAWGSDIMQYRQEGLLYRRMVRFILERATCFTADSLHLAALIREIVPHKKLAVTVANFGVELSPGQSNVKENIIYSNRLHKDLYRIDKVIEQAAMFFRSQSEPWRLIIGGIGPKTGMLKALATSLGFSDQVEFTGWMDEEKKNSIYRKAKIFVSIPKSDATSISLLEAMACGCLPVVSNLPANLEWVIDGLNGVVADDLEREYFSRALALDKNLVNDINPRLIAQKASLATNQEKYLSLYNELAPNLFAKPRSAISHG